MDIWQNIKYQFNTGNMLMKIIFINIFVFVVAGLLKVVCYLFQLSALDWEVVLSLPSDWTLLFVRPWTVFTYMFLHDGVWHILFNMLMLYWFGQMFLLRFSERHLLGLYLQGGIAGGLLFVLAYTLLPVLTTKFGMLQGASAAVMAVAFGISVYAPQQRVRLFLVGNVQLVYIALAMLLIDLLSLGSERNIGGHIAHIGGAGVGYLFAKLMLKGIDLTAWINRMADLIVDTSDRLRSPRPKMKVKHRQNEYKERESTESDAIDAILDKVKQSGYQSLSQSEKKRLFDASNQKK